MCLSAFTVAEGSNFPVVEFGLVVFCLNGLPCEKSLVNERRAPSYPVPIRGTEEVLADIDGTGGTVQIEYGLVSHVDHVDVDVGGPMIVRVADDARPV